MTLRRKPKRTPAENPILRTHFVDKLLDSHQVMGDVDGFLEHLAPDLERPVPLPTPGPELTDLLIGDDDSGVDDPPDNSHVRLTEPGRLYFRAWLRHHGIDPDTGKMTLTGLAFFEQLVADQNAHKRAQRDHRAA